MTGVEEPEVLLSLPGEAEPKSDARRAQLHLFAKGSHKYFLGLSIYFVVRMKQKPYFFCS